MRKSPSGRPLGYVKVFQAVGQVIPNAATTILAFAGAAVDANSNINVTPANNGVIIPRLGMYQVLFRIQWDPELNGLIQCSILGTPSGGVPAVLDQPTIDSLDDTNLETHTQWAIACDLLPPGMLVQAQVSQTSGGGAGDMGVANWTLTIVEV